MPRKKQSEPSPLRKFLAVLGPGFITGASDDDPSGIATYSQVGAQFGYGMLWTMLFSFPFMGAVQEISGRIGRVTGKGIAANLRDHYSYWVLAPLAVLLFVANTINAGADIAAIGAVVKLVAGGDPQVYALIAGFVSLLLQVLFSYEKYVNYLKWLTLVLFTYVAVAFLAHVHWGEAVRGTLVPHFGGGKQVLMALLAVLGTTISPYLLFWQASAESEEVQKSTKRPLKSSVKQQPEIVRIKVDTYVGMAFSNLVAWFIMLAAAATLHVHGVTQINSAADAAKALEPVAGQFAFWLFCLGVVGTGMLAVPVLAGSAAYAVGEALRWPVGLERKPLQAKGFYGVIALSVGVGLVIASLKINPMQALFWSAVVNGIVAGPLLVVVMLLASNAKVMSPKLVIGPWLKALGWATAVLMFLAAAGLLVI